MNKLSEIQQVVIRYAIVFIIFLAAAALQTLEMSNY